MTSFRFIHAADVHLGSPLRGLDQHAELPADLVRAAPSAAFVRLVDWCLEERVELLVLAGDLFDGDCPYPVALECVKQLGRLADAGVHVVSIRGNHDAAAKLTSGLRLPGVKELSTQEPERWPIDELGVEVVGQGFARQHVEESLADRYPRPDPDRFSIALLHTGLEGYEGHGRYAPCTLAQLVDLGYDYWALGHVHERQVLCEQPWILYPGNLQGRKINEPGPRGATLVTVVDGQVSGEPEHRDLDVLRWERWAIDADGAAGPQAALDALEDRARAYAGEGELPLIVRVVLEGRTRAHRELAADREHWAAEARGRLATAAPDLVFLEKLAVRTEPPLPSRAELAAADGPLGLLARRIEALAADPAALADYLPEFERFNGKLPREIATGDPELGVPGLKVERVEQLAALLPAVERDLFSRLGALALDGDGADAGEQ